MSNTSYPIDYPEATGYWAHETNYRMSANLPRGFVLHTPEEPADDYPSTPVYFAAPNRDASTHYFAAYTGRIYQCVPEKYMAIANGVVGKPYPAWANAAVSLNRQSLSVEIEGYAASIGETLKVGSAQWHGLVALIRHRAQWYGFPTDRAHIIGHYEVSNERSDPGATFPWDALMAELQGEAPMTPAERQEMDALKAIVWQQAVKNNGQDVILVDHALRLNKLDVHTAHPPK